MSFELAVHTPAPVSSLAFASLDLLCAGSDDGTSRLYHLPSPKVIRAIKSLGSEIASVACNKNSSPQSAELWLASGPRALLFPANSDKLILSAEDARCILDLGEDDEDVLNRLSLSENKRHLAFSTDGGTVGVVELSTRKVTRMRTRHSSICGTVSFIPDRPSELISGGYDSALLHHDLLQATLSSRLDITAPPPSSQVSLSPPFILSMSMSSTALFAASTADGRVWLGGGGEKRPAPTSGVKKKRSRKWEGLKEEEGLWIRVAEGPVVAIEFAGADSLITCTLLGKVARYSVSRSTEGELQAEQSWSMETENVAKVNTIAVCEHWLCIGGFDKVGKGLVEVWSMNSSEGHEDKPNDVH